MKYDLHERIAKCLGWSVEDVRSFSLASVRDMVRGKDDALHDEISLIIQQGLHITDPIRDPRRVPMPDMSWLGPPPKIPSCCTFHALNGPPWRSCSEEDPHTRADRDMNPKR